MTRQLQAIQVRLQTWCRTKSIFSKTSLGLVTGSSPGRVRRGPVARDSCARNWVRQIRVFCDNAVGQIVVTATVKHSRTQGAEYNVVMLIPKTGARFVTMPCPMRMLQGTLRAVWSHCWPRPLNVARGVAGELRSSLPQESSWHQAQDHRRPRALFGGEAG